MEFQTQYKQSVLPLRERSRRTIGPNSQEPAIQIQRIREGSLKSTSRIQKYPSGQLGITSPTSNVKTPEGSNTCPTQSVTAAGCGSENIHGATRESTVTPTTVLQSHHKNKDITKTGTARLSEDNETLDSSNNTIQIQHTQILQCKS